MTFNAFPFIQAMVKKYDLRRFFAVVLLGSAAACGPPAFAVTSAEVDVLLQKLARDMNTRLPSGVDDARIVMVLAEPGRRFTYRTISGKPANVWSSEMKAHSRRIAVNDYCTNPSMEAFKDFDVTVTWQLSDKEGRHISTNIVSPKDCRR